MQNYSVALGIYCFLCIFLSIILSILLCILDNLQGIRAPQLSGCLKVPQVYLAQYLHNNHSARDYNLDGGCDYADWNTERN